MMGMPMPPMGMPVGGMGMGGMGMGMMPGMMGGMGMMPGMMGMGMNPMMTGMPGKPTSTIYKLRQTRFCLSTCIYPARDTGGRRPNQRRRV